MCSLYVSLGDLIRLILRSSMLIPAGDITHGGLSLKETPAWVEAKKAIEAESGYHIVQWHKDELSGEVRSYDGTFRVLGSRY